MKGFLERLTTLGYIVSAFSILYVIWNTLDQSGEDMAAIPDSPTYWGWTWASENLPWIALAVVIVVCAVILVISRHKK